MKTLLRAQLQSAGANYFIGQFAFGDISLDEALRSVNLFAEHVAPGLD